MYANVKKCCKSQTLHLLVVSDRREPATSREVSSRVMSWSTPSLPDFTRCRRKGLPPLVLNFLEPEIGFFNCAARLKSGSKGDGCGLVGGDVGAPAATGRIGSCILRGKK